MKLLGFSKVEVGKITAGKKQEQAELVEEGREDVCPQGAPD